MKDRLKNKLPRLKIIPAQKPDMAAILARTGDVSEPLSRGMEAVEELFLIMKNEMPHLFENFKEAVFKQMTSEDIEAFYARVALKEAYKTGKTTEPPPAYVLPKRPEYEMPDDYKLQLETLARMIESRDEHARLIPTLPAALRAEAMPALRDLSDAVESIEQKLAEEYERFQEEQNALESRLSIITVHGWMRTARQFLFIKKYQPQELEAFKNACMEEEEWVDIARWIDRLESEGYDPPPALTAK